LFKLSVSVSTIYAVSIPGNSIQRDAPLVRNSSHCVIKQPRQVFPISFCETEILLNRKPDDFCRSGRNLPLRDATFLRICHIGEAGKNKHCSGIVIASDLVNHAKEIARLAREEQMLWIIAVSLIVLWALGLITSYTMGGFIHFLLVVAVIVVLVRIIRGDRRI
jgi:hypothetical protein